MKTVFALIIFLSFASFSAAQNTTASNETIEMSHVIKDNTSEIRKANTSSRVKSRVKKISDKKNNEIISIKAYKKSLNDKIKIEKLC